MYCINCGADNLETAKFCRKCGAAVSGRQTADSGQHAAVEEETQIAVRRGNDLNREKNYRDQDTRSRSTERGRDRADINEEAAETEIFTINPTLLFVKVGYALAAFGAVLLAALTSIFLSEYVSVWFSVLIGFLLFLIPAFYHFRQKIVRYTLTDSKLEIDEGFISRTTRSIPVRRIQDVTVSAGVTQRMLGVGDLSIDNASDDEGKIVLKNINRPRHFADVLLRQMRRLDQ